MKLTTLLALLFVLVSTGSQLTAREYRYRIVVVNLSEGRISALQIADSAAKQNYGGGSLLASGYRANEGPMSTPPNDVFTVRWTNGDNVAREQQFDLSSRIKPNFKGEIVFVHGEDKTFAVEILNPPKRYPIP